jgi:ABC-type glutathione transport system ATPase component
MLAYIIREQGRVKDVLERPQDVYTKALLHCRPQLSKRPMRLPMISDFMQQKGDDYIETHTVDVESLQQRSRGLTGQEEIILDVRDLKKSFYSRKVGAILTTNMIRIGNKAYLNRFSLKLSLQPWTGNQLS